MEKRLINIFIFLVLFSVLIPSFSTAANPAHSENFLIVSDSINFVGNLSTSSNYQLQDTGGEAGTGTSTSASYNLRAGYQAMDSNEILFVEVPDSGQFLSPSVDVQVGGSASLSLLWKVTGTSGYTFSVAGSDLSGTETVPEYYTNSTLGWSVLAGASAYGFSPSSDDLVDSYKNDGVSCGLGATTSNCWQGFGNSTTTPLLEHQIAENSNPSAHREVTVNLKAEIAPNSFLQQVMTGTIYVTVVSQ